MRRIRWILYLQLLVLVAQPALGYIPGNTGSVPVSPFFSDTYAPYTSVGIVRTRTGRYWGRGSAAVAKNKRLLYSCAHLVYDYGAGWASTFAFCRKHNSRVAPKPSSYVVARGYRIRAGYAPSGDDFDYDFAVAYGGAATDFGPPLAIDATPIDSITSEKVEKRILGYPADLDDSPWANTGRYFMYETGPFFKKIYSDYNNAYSGGEYLAYWTTTGAGNSGGPLVVYDLALGRWELSAILVSGSNYDDYWNGYAPYTGVHVLDEACNSLAVDALGFATNGAFATRSNTTSDLMANGGKRYSSRSFNFSGTGSPDSQGPAFGVASEVTEVLLDLNISAGRRGDIDAYIRSPRGRTAIAAVASTIPGTQDAPNLILADYDAARPFNPFFGSNPRGTWRLYFRDAVSGANVSRFNGATLKLRTRWPL